MSKRVENLRFFSELGGQQLVDDILTTEHLLEQRRKLSELTQPAAAGQWRILGAVERVYPYEQGLRLECEHGAAELHIIAPNCLRVRTSDSPDAFQHTPFSYCVQKTDWADVPFEWKEGTEAVEIRTSAHVCRVGKFPFRIGIETLDGHLICIDTIGPQHCSDGAVRLTMKMHPGESCYGLGERASGLNLRGKKFQLWNTDAQDYNRGTDPLYYSIPFYLGLHGDIAYGLFWDNTGRGFVDLGQDVPGELSFESQSGEMRYYLFTGTDANSVLSRYTELTGRIKLPPLWFLGYQQSRFSYYSQEALLELAREFRQRGIPCDVVYLDIHYMDGFRVFTWDQIRFPDLPNLISALHRQGYKVIAILDPGIKIDPDYEVYHSGIRDDVFLKYADGELVQAAVWPGLCHFPDFTKPVTRSWWASQCQKILSTGIDGIWNDMCEPAIFTPEASVSLPDTVIHDGDGQGGTHQEYHNVYGMQMGRSSLQALVGQYPDRRPVNIIRAGFAGAQRYASTWTGDNTSEWDHLRLSISMALNMGLSGAPMTGPDIGGFHGDADGELLTRWLQAACLMPYFRNHTSFGTKNQEPWAFGQPYEVINRLTIELRYRLLPYLYSVIAQSKEHGWPIIRPIFTAEPYNPDIRDIDDCYLLGDTILVAPVTHSGTTLRSVYLPAGNWYDYWTNECLEGGQFVTAPAPLERLPLFVKAGAVLPLWSERQFTEEKSDTTLLMRIYPGEKETVLYEDAGEGLAYEQGEYRWIYLSSSWDDNTLRINRRSAGRYEPDYRALKLEVIDLDDEPAEVLVDRKGAPLWFFDEGLLELTVTSFQRLEIVCKPTTADRTLISRPR